MEDDEIIDAFKYFPPVPRKEAKAFTKEINRIFESMEDTILILAKNNSIVSLGKIYGKITGVHSGVGFQIAFDNAIKDLVSYNLIVVESGHVKLSDDGRRLLVELPAKYQSKPYTYFSKRKKAQIQAEDRDNWKKRFWLPIAIITFLIGLGSGIFTESWRERLKQDNQNLSKPGIPKSDTSKQPTKVLPPKK